MYARALGKYDGKKQKHTRTQEIQRQGVEVCANGGQSKEENRNKRSRKPDLEKWVRANRGISLHLGCKSQMSMRKLWRR